MASKPDVSRMVREKDTEGLRLALRYKPNAAVRKDAARAAGKLMASALVEDLNRSLREDPDEDVQYQAFLALVEILGKNRAEDVINSYNSGSAYPDEWLQVPAAAAPDPGERKTAARSRWRGPKIAEIAGAQDAAALEEALRFGPDPEIRRQAARAAARWENYDPVEALNRALREDPDEGVRRAAREALADLLGNQADEVIASYDRGAGYDDEWLQEEAEEPNVVEWQTVPAAPDAAGRPNVARILADGNAPALEEAMRYGPDVQVRKMAVRAAGQLGNYDLIEALTRSLQEDPEEAVRNEAYEALFAMLGKRREEVISSYADVEYEDDWILTDPFIYQQEEGEADPAMEGGEWDEGSLWALFNLATGRNGEAKAVNAVEAIASVGTTRAVEGLIALALHGRLEAVRLAAREELENFYGDDLDEVLASYQREDLALGIEGMEELPEGESGPEDETEDERNPQWTDLEQPGASIRREAPRQDMPSVFHEEGLSVVQIAMVAVGVLVVIGLVALAMGR